MMNENLSKNITAHLTSNLRKRRWHKVVTVMAAIVVFCTTYALILPAVTMTNELDCGLEAHTHTDECYQTELVYPQPEYVCTPPEDGEEEHIHTDDCLGEAPEPVETQVLICGLEEHEHTDACYVTYEDEPAYYCGLSEHAHTDECSDEEGTLTCSIPEHSHTEECLLSARESEKLYATLELDEQYPYELDEVQMLLHITGQVQIPTEGQDLSGLQPSDLEFSVENELLESENEDALIERQLYFILSYNGQPLDLSGCEITAELTPSEYLMEFMRSGSMAYAIHDMQDEPDSAAVQDGALAAAAVPTDGAPADATPADDTPADSTPADDTPADATAANDTLAVPAGDAPADTAEPSFEANTVLDTAPVANTVLDTAPATGTDPEPAEDGIEISVTDAEGNSSFLLLSADMEEITPLTFRVAGASMQVRTAPTPNPHFTVQYFAQLDRVVTYSTNSTDGTRLPVIDTSASGDGNGGNKPQNGNMTPPVNYLNITKTGQLETRSTLTEIYEQQDFYYISAPGLNYFDIVTTTTESYDVNTIQVFRPSTKSWQSYPFGQAERQVTHFTNRDLGENKAPGHTYIQIETGMIIKMIYTAVTQEEPYTNEVDFYDYDISDGHIYPSSDFSEANRKNTSTQSNNSKAYAKTYHQGINSETNYSGSTDKVKFAFGNANSGNGWDHGATKENQIWKDASGKSNLLNLYNRKSNGGTDTYRGGTYGLVTGMNGSGTDVVFDTKVDAPSLFGGDADVTGKTHIDGNLNFTRVGDTYTLASLGLEGKTLSNLDIFEKVYDNGKGTKIYSNSFWPMDIASTWGADGHDMKFGSTAFSGNRQYRENNKDLALPTSDDEKDHNSYFGMNFAVQFDLTSRYIGPLEYYFFGDDDMWVFLAEYDKEKKAFSNEKLICDIGGVHSATGEYVDLWDYIDRDSLTEVDENGNEVEVEKSYALVFFYTERGASGSTCWMQFTLPTVVGLNLEPTLDELLKKNTSALVVKKTVSGVTTDTEFSFKINLKNQDGTALLDDYLYTKYNKDGSKVTGESGSGVILLDEALHDGSTFTLKDGQYIVIANLPVDSIYRVEEIAPGDSSRFPYRTSWTVTTTDIHNTVHQQRMGEGRLVYDDQQNQIEKDRKDTVHFTNTATIELPATGGTGTTLIYVTGGLLLLLAACLSYKKFLFFLRGGVLD